MKATERRPIVGVGPALTRRAVLRLLAGATAAAGFPFGVARLSAGWAAAVSTSSYGFLTAAELAILDAATAHILPTDDRPGAREIGVVGYVQSLLSFLPGADANCDRRVDAADVTAVWRQAAGAPPLCPPGGDVNGDAAVDGRDVTAAQAAVFRARPVFAGGPFSGRNPQPHFPIGSTPCVVCHGAGGGAAAAGGAGQATVDVFPPDAFREFLPLTRLQVMSWKVRLLGAEAVPEVAENPLAASLPDVALRGAYRDGLAQLDDIGRAQFGLPFVELAADQRTQVLNKAPAFRDLVTRHVIEGTLCAPEYGGNRDQLGWQLVGFDGDSQPLGYEIYDASVEGNYRERPDKPNSGPNPDEDCSGFSANLDHFLDLISGVTGGRRFSDPYCFGVDA